MSHPYQYIVLHQSVRNHPGVCACQAAHAAGESIRTAPVSDQTHVVALVAETSADLEKLAEDLRALGVHHVVIREPDEPYWGAATAVGTEPGERTRPLRALMDAFKVLR